jgi:hypothetical protein
MSLPSSPRSRIALVENEQRLRQAARGVKRMLAGA